MAALSKEEIRKTLKNLPGWALRGNAIYRKFTFKSFMIAQRLTMPDVCVTLGPLEAKVGMRAAHCCYSPEGAGLCDSRGNSGR
jgi:hypothetical protein